MPHHKTYALGEVRLQSGETLRNARLAYATYGTLNAAGDNVVLLPTFYTGTHLRNEPLFGPGRAIDPARHFIVSINLFGNGLSSSPSNSAAPQDGPRFPHVTLFDNVVCQHRLLTEHLGVRRLALGGAIPRYGRSHPALLRLRALLSHQSRLSRRAQGGVAGRCRLVRG
jgi:homoserine O-acetyltransferase